MLVRMCVVGSEFWKQLCYEHGIQADGTALPSPDPSTLTRPSAFFYQSDSAHFTPRSIMLDLEPRVINSIMQSSHGAIYNPDNIFVSGDGSGAGNNWASGYSQGLAVKNAIMDMIDREVDSCDSLEVHILDARFSCLGTVYGAFDCWRHRVRSRIPPPRTPP